MKWSDAGIAAVTTLAAADYFLVVQSATSKTCTRTKVFDGIAASSPITFNSTTGALALSTVPIASGGTNSTTALSNGRVMVSSAGAIVERAALTASALTVGDATAGVASLALGTANQVVGMNAGATANEYKTVAGTTNQVTVTHAANSVTLSTPQDLHTAATPTFGILTLTSAGSLVLGVGSSVTGQILLKNSTNNNSLTLQAGATGVGVTFTLPTADGTNGQFVKTNGSGVLSFADGGSTGANPTGTVGLTAVNGVATTFLRSDGAPALSQSIAPTWTGQHIHSLSNAAAVTIGPNGDTNPVLRVVTNVASAATGISVTGNAAGSGVDVTVLSSGTNENVNVVPKGTGNVVLKITNSTQQIISFNSIASGYAGVHLVASPSSTNYALLGGSGDPGTTFVNGPSADVRLLIANVEKARVNSSGLNLVSGHSLGFGSVSAPDATLTRQAALVLGTDWLLEAAGHKRLTANATNATTTMANLTDLSVTLISGRKYALKCIIFVSNSAATDGAKFDFDGGTATMTSFRAHGTLFDTALLLSTQVSAIATDFAQATVTGDAMFECHGAFVCNAGGTFIPRFATNTAVSGTLTAYANSSLVIEELSA